MKFQITNNTKNIGKRNIYFNKSLTIKLYDGIIEKQFDIKPGESIVIIVDDNYQLPWGVCELERKELLIINKTHLQFVKTETVINSIENNNLQLSEEIPIVVQKKHNKKKK